MEEDLIREIKENKVVDEPCLFPKDEWDSLIEWHQVAEEKCDDTKDFPKEKCDPYEHAPKKVKEYHEAYIWMWLKERGK